MRLIQHYPVYYRQKLERYIEAYTEPDPYFSYGWEVLARKCGEEFVLSLTGNNKSEIKSFQAIVSFEEHYTDVRFEKDPTQKRMQNILAVLVGCVVFFLSFYQHNYGPLLLFCLMLIIVPVVEHFMKQEFETIILNFLNRD